MCLLSFMDSNRCIWTNLNNTPLRLIGSGDWHMDDYTFVCFNGVRWIFKRFADSFQECSSVLHGVQWIISNRRSQRWRLSINKCRKIKGFEQSGWNLRPIYNQISKENTLKRKWKRQWDFPVVAFLLYENNYFSKRFYTAGIMTNHKLSVIFNAERKSGPTSPQKGWNSDEHNYDFKLFQTRTIWKSTG